MSELYPYESAEILALAVASKINMMYVEFSNDGDAVAPPVLSNRADGRSYYDELDTHPTQDYLRVDLIARQVTSSDADLYPDGNQVAFIAITAGTEGVHGKPFSAAAGSRVIGSALVYASEEVDQTTDMVFYRQYLEEAEQLLKQDNAQITVTRTLVFA